MRLQEKEEEEEGGKKDKHNKKLRDFSLFYI